MFRRFRKKYRLTNDQVYAILLSINHEIYACGDDEETAAYWNDVYQKISKYYGVDIIDLEEKL